jgi:hypothetical protein
MPRLAWFALAPCFLLSGCFSMMSQSDFGMGNGGGPPAGAVVLDAVTLPAQLPLFAVVGVSKAHQNAKAREEIRLLLAELEQNPELIFDKKRQSFFRLHDQDKAIKEWLSLKVEQPQAFDDDFLYELYRHKTAAAAVPDQIPRRASPALLDRLFADYAAHCVSDSSWHHYHLHKLYRVYASPDCRDSADILDEFIMAQPAKAKQLLSVFDPGSGGGPAHAPWEWQSLNQANERVKSGAAAARFAGRKAVRRAEKDPSVVLRADFWAELPRYESRALVEAWMIRALRSKVGTVFKDEQLFELYKMDNVVPQRHRLTFLPEQISPREKLALFEHVYDHNIGLVPDSAEYTGLVPDSADKYLGLSSLLQAWCLRAIGEEQWVKKETADKFVSRYPQRSQQLVDQYRLRGSPPSFVSEIEAALRR